MSDHPRDCPHGRQWGKCDTCDLATAYERIIGLVDENKQLQAERDYAALEYKREHALRLEIEAEVERLQRVIVATPRDDGLVCWWCDQQVWTNADDESEPTYHPELHKEDCEYRLAEDALDKEVGE